MKHFDAAEFEQSFFWDLYKKDIFDIPSLDRKILYNGQILRVIMTNSAIVSVINLKTNIDYKGVQYGRI